MLAPVAAPDAAPDAADDALEFTADPVVLLLETFSLLNESDLIALNDLPIMYGRSVFSSGRRYENGVSYENGFAASDLQLSWTPPICFPQSIGLSPSQASP